MGSKIEVGSQVRFLDSVGGGIVRRIGRDGLLYVDDGSGFEMPMSQNEVLLVATAERKVTPPKSDSTSAQKPEPTIVDDKRERSTEEASDAPISAYLAIALEEGGKAPGESGYEVYFINDSNYDLTILYLSGKSQDKELKYMGTVPFDTVDLVETFKPDRVPDHEHITVQVLAHRDDRAFVPKPAFSVDLRIEGARFFKKGAFTENPFFDFDVLLLPIIEEDRPFVGQKVDGDKLLSQMMAQKKRADDKPTHGKRQGRIERSREKVVVDLHIDELVDTTAGMQPLDILQLQLSKVEVVMGKYYAKPQYRGQVIIFIHGKGDGVLRKEVQSLISRKYPKTEQQDASFQEYGFGATQVTLR